MSENGIWPIQLLVFQARLWSSSSHDIETSNWCSYWLSIPVGYWYSTSILVKWFTGTGTGDVVYWCVRVWMMGPNWECFWLNCVPVSTLV